MEKIIKYLLITICLIYFATFYFKDKYYELDSQILNVPNFENTDINYQKNLKKFYETYIKINEPEIKENNVQRKIVATTTKRVNDTHKIVDFKIDYHTYRKVHNYNNLYIVNDIKYRDSFYNNINKISIPIDITINSEYRNIDNINKKLIKVPNYINQNLSESLNINDKYEVNFNNSRLNEIVVFYMYEKKDTNLTKFFKLVPVGTVVFKIEYEKNS